MEDCRDVTQDRRASCLIARGERLLRVGRVDEAQTNIDDALAVAPYSSDAKALSSIISLVKNDKADALRLAEEAVDTNSSSAPAWLALSYAQQADFKLEAALASAKRAAELTPLSALAFARVAELQLSLGWIREAEKSAKQAVAANPSEGRAYMILGFTHLAQINVQDAHEDFEKAIGLDSTDPLARLGLGLAIIRVGKLVEGREQIEIAVALDPTNSLLRSYVGKAYYDEKEGARDRLAGVQFELAKTYDRLDPTPWFYDAIRKQTDNRAGESLSDLQRSIELNDDRAVYRSRLLLDQDSASRSVGLARIYTDVGFGQLALAEGVKSLTSDPGSYSAHRFLADSYASIPRFDAARVSELLQSQLLQPATASALQPQLGEGGLLILDRAGPPVASFQEFNPLFERDRFTAYASGVAGNKGTFGDELLLSAQKQGNLFSVGQFHYQTDGFRENDDLKQDIYTAFVQKDVSYQSSLQAEFRSSRTNRGDVVQNFDSNSFSTTSRVHLDTQTGRLGARHSLDAQSTFLASVTLGDLHGSSNDQTVDNSLGIPLFIQTNTTGDSHVANGELQYLFRSDLFTLTAGGGYYDESFNNMIGAKVTLEDGTLLTDVVGVDDSAIRHENAYLYSNINVDPHATLILGISGDSFKDSNIISTEQLNPKFGLVFRPGAETTLRLAAFRYLKRSLAASATLEPTQVAGFNQIFDDVNGTDSKTVGAGLDQTLSKNLFAGVQLMARNLTVPLAPAIGIDQPASSEHWRERLYRAYASWLVTPALAFNTQINYERQERDFPSGVPSEFLSSIETLLAPLTFTYRDSGGFFAQIRATYVTQTVEYPATTGTTSESDRFWLADASLGYRLPRRLGIISLNATNLFDRSFRFQDTSLNGAPRPPLFWQGRLVFASFTLAL
ncbi:MAG: tetratricopeptide repeat protein [Betaproteobacteria bacterium]